MALPVVCILLLMPQLSPAPSQERTRRPTLAAFRLNSTLTVGRSEDMRFRRQHHIVEGLREHRRREEGNGPQGLGAGILEIVPDRRRQDEDASGADGMSGAVFHLELAGAGDDVLRLLGGVGVPAQPLARRRRSSRIGWCRVSRRVRMRLTT